MRPKVRNREELLASGDSASRAAVLDVLEETLSEMDSYKRIQEFVIREVRYSG
jgi:hypothetical protein